MATVADASETLPAAVEALAAEAAARGDEIERSRRLPADLVQAQAQAGLFRLFAPREYGGLETDPLTYLRAIETLARADASTGWIAMVGAMGSRFVASARAETLSEIFAGHPAVFIAGGATARGRSRRVAGGYRVSARWAFGSGCEHSDWLTFGTAVCEGDAPARGPDGAALTRNVIIPTAEAAILDTWRTAGLRGTGSHDFVVDDLFVPEARTFTLNWEAPPRPGPVFAVPGAVLFAAGAAAVPLGLARHAIDALVDLAQAKTPTGQTSLLRERAAVQTDIARAEAMLRAGRAFLVEALDELWQTVLAGGAVGAKQRMTVRLAATHAARSAGEAVDLLYNAAGATAIYTSSPLERCFRDVHTVLAHGVINPATLEAAGKVLLGLPSPYF